jgi:uncharacterized coiled-coil protein SlyX
MYKVNGLLSFPARRRVRELDFRAPEDSLSVDEDDEEEIRSPGIDRMIRAYYDADDAGDDIEKASALRGMIDEMTALHKLRGVPVFAHPPLPPQFVAAQVDGAKYAGGTDVVSKITNLVDPNNRSAVKMQLAGSLARQRRPLAPLANISVGGNGLSETWARAADLPRDDLRNADDDPRRSFGLQTLAGASRLPNAGAVGLLARQAPNPTRVTELLNGASKQSEKPTDDCEKYRRDYAQQRRAIDEADRAVAQQERRIRDLRTQRQDWLNEIAEIEADLRAVRARSTDPDLPIVQCPRTGRDPLKRPRGPRERRRDREQRTQEVGCDLVGRIDRELGKDKWRERLEQSKAEDIRELEADLRSARLEVQKIDALITKAEADVEKARDKVRDLQGGLGWLNDQHKDSCSDRR